MISWLVTNLDVVFEWQFVQPYKPQEKAEQSIELDAIARPHVPNSEKLVQAVAFIQRWKRDFRDRMGKNPKDELTCGF